MLKELRPPWLRLGSFAQVEPQALPEQPESRPMERRRLAGKASCKAKFRKCTDTQAIAAAYESTASAAG